MNPIVDRIIEQALKRIDLHYTDRALPKAVIDCIIADIDQELNKLKWVRDDEGWNRAVQAIRAELKQRYR